MRLAVDVVEYFAREHPHWEPIEFCGYHVRDSGGNAVHEVAVATANGIAYLDEAKRRGVDISELAPSLYLFLSTSVDVFEEAAKLRAARRLWARILTERYGVPPERAGINFFVYTLGGMLTAQEPLNNVVRVAYESLAAALGGAQTLATSSYDEALGLPSPDAAHLALRTQQIAALESGATKVVDPLGGSYYVEALTDRLGDAFVDELLLLAKEGGAVAALESGWIQSRIADAAYRYQGEVEAGTRPVVGVNVHHAEPEQMREVFTVRAELEAEQRASLSRRRADRNEASVERALEALRGGIAAGENSVPLLAAALRERATVGEVSRVLASVYGSYRPVAMRLG
jgi:methylmalonyl-CoA mutase N-terminal domain/subunit